MLFSSHGGRMDPSKLFRNGGVVACSVGNSASDSDASQPATVKLRPKLGGTSSLKPQVRVNNVSKQPTQILLVDPASASKPCCGVGPGAGDDQLHPRAVTAGADGPGGASG